MPNQRHPGFLFIRSFCLLLRNNHTLLNIMNHRLRKTAATLFLCMTAIMAMAQDMPVSSLPIKTINGKQYHYYEVQPKETIYSLSHKLGIDKQTIEQYNPTIKDGIRNHTILYFPVSEDSDASQPATPPGGTIVHKAKKGESAYAIAHQYGVSVADLVAANPNILDGVKAKDNVIIPSTAATTQPADTDEPAQQQPTNSIFTREPVIVDLDDSTDSIDSEEETVPTQINIAVLLPFQSDRDKPAKQALYYTDFLKGLLMAVDTMRHVETPIHVAVFDTYENADSVRTILTREAIADASVIIAPEDSLQIDIIAQWADSTETKVLNMFAVRNALHESHPSLIQGNIPHEMMYDKALNSFMARFRDYTPVLLSNSAEDADKTKFVDMLAARLTSDGIEYRAISHNGNLDEAQLDWMQPDTKYVFVPTASSRVVLNSILPAIIAKKRAAESPDNVALFGYPEWIIIRGELQQKLHEANTTIYSRFVMNPDNYRSRTLENQFRQWYGSAMIPTVPMYGTLGFDTGMWIINAIQDPENKEHYTGIQNGFHLSRTAPDQGYVNNSLFLINFMPTGLIESSNCD